MTPVPDPPDIKRELDEIEAEARDLGIPLPATDELRERLGRVMPEEEVIAIARELAASQPTVASGTWHWCGVCGKSLAMDDDPASHADDCLWVRLRTALGRLDASAC